MHQETISKSEIVGLGTKVENEKESPLGPSAPLGLQICKVVTILKEITRDSLAKIRSCVPGNLLYCAISYLFAKAINVETMHS